MARDGTWQPSLTDLDKKLAAKLAPEIQKRNPIPVSEPEPAEVLRAGLLLLAKELGVEA